jgi:hypothetical protein
VAYERKYCHCENNQFWNFDWFLHVISPLNKKVVFGTLSVCKYVCTDVCLATRRLINLWLYKGNNKLRDSKNVFTLHIPPWAPHTYDFVVLTSLIHPRKIILVVLQIGKKENPKTYQQPYVWLKGWTDFIRIYYLRVYTSKTGVQWIWII